MLRNDQKRVIPIFLLSVLTVLAVSVFWAFQTFVPFARPDRELAPCREIENGSQQVECIFKVIDNELHIRGVIAAEQVFARAYSEFPAFLQVGCHRQAHRVGDLTYFEIYLRNEDMDAIDFPQSTTACGYGFFHGFMEHLIQDHPDPVFVTKTCNYLQNRLGSTMGDIRLTCYHGSGHGFTLAQLERVPKRLWGSAKAFTTHPLQQCEELSEALLGEVEQCKEGVFNVLVDWMELGDNGFSLDREHVFSVCEGVKADSRQACYYEMAQKLDGFSKHDPRVVYTLVKSISDEGMRMLSFRVGVAGIIQNVIEDPGGYQKTLRGCTELPEAYYRTCLVSVVNGLFEHGEPQREYVKALDICTLPSVEERKLWEPCYQTVATRLPRFYTDEGIRNICTEFPESYRHFCIEKIGTHEAGR